MKNHRPMKWQFGIIAFAAALALNFFAIRYVVGNVHSPESYDFLFALLPFSTVGYVLAWGIIINVGLGLYGVIKYPKRFAFALYASAGLYLVRGIMLMTTVLGVPAARVTPHPGNFLFAFSYSGNDFFFSGHTAFPFLLALVFWDKKPLRFLFLTMTAVFAVGSILARTHYSIDVLAAPIIAYAVFMFFKQWEHGDILAL